MSDAEKLKPEELARLEKIDSEIAGVEGRRESALSRLREVEGSLAEVSSRQGEIALDVVSGEGSALKEDEELAERHVRASREARTFRLAVGQADKKIAELADSRQEEEMAIHRDRHEDLSRRRYKLEQKAEKQLDAFLGAVTELDELDRAQDIERRGAGIRESWVSHRSILTMWVEGRLGGSGNLLPGLDGRVPPDYRSKTLAEVDPRASERAREGGGS